MIRFGHPEFLFMLLILPLIMVIGWPAHGSGRRREAISLALRCLLIVCVVLALANLEFPQPASFSSRAVVFVVDVSASISSAERSAQDDYMREALQQMRPGDQAAIVVFGEQALLERPMSTNRVFTPLASNPGPNGSNLKSAIELALSLYPPNFARRMIILSDGQYTGGDPRQAVRLASQVGVEVVAADLPISGQDTNKELILKDINIPGHLRQGDQFDLNLTLESNQPLTSTVPVTVLANGTTVYTGSLDLSTVQKTAGLNGFRYPFSLPLIASQAGFTQYQVLISPGNQVDTFFQNNEMSSYTQVSGSPLVLLVAPPPGEELPGGESRPDETTLLEMALKGMGANNSAVSPGYQLQKITPLQMPGEVQRLVKYSAVLLVDVPASQLTELQMEGLQRYVRLGGGLVAIGGPTSYGVGGYFDTPLEQVLPVEMQIKDEQRRPSLGIVFIIDHSGSMSELSGGQTKLEIAKEAVIRSLDLLTPRDRVGILAFDDQAMWVSPISVLDNKIKVKNLVGTLQSGGGTDILAGIQAMARILPGDPAVNKHVILLTDGGADPTGIPDLVKSLFDQYGITLSTIGVGRDAASFLPDLARLGGGRYHFAATPAQIPRIFSEETALATRSYIVEGSFFPQLVSAELADTLGIRSIPPLLGYVATSAKDGSQVILQAPPPNRDPILAVWNYGLGKAAAFTSDASTRWASAWVFNNQANPVLRAEYVQFWQGLVRYVMGNPANKPLDIQVQTTTDQNKLVARVNIDTASTGSLLNGYTMQATILDPQGQEQTIRLMQISPGRYAGSFLPSEQGVYVLHIICQPPSTDAISSTGEAIGETTGWVLSYSPEFAHLKTKYDRQQLLLLIAAGNLVGAPFIPSQEAFAFIDSSANKAEAYPAWPWLLEFAAILLPIDIAIRRLLITPSDIKTGVQKMRSAVSSIVSARGSQVAAPSRSEQIEILFRAKAISAEKSRQISSTNMHQEQEQTSLPILETPIDGDANQPSEDHKLYPAKTSFDQALSIHPSLPEEGNIKPDSTSVSSLLKSKRQRIDSSKRKD